MSLTIYRSYFIQNQNLTPMYIQIYVQGGSKVPSYGNIPKTNHVLVDCDFSSPWNHTYVADIPT